VGIRELTAASQTLKPSMTEFQGAVMIADVKGFTQLTEILSKKGEPVQPFGLLPAVSLSGYMLCWDQA
jgi:hypothetical protein